MALQRSDSYLFWVLTWDDVVEPLPTPQKPLQPNGLEKVMPGFLQEKGTLRNGLKKHLLNKQ